MPSSGLEPEPTTQPSREDPGRLADCYSPRSIAVVWLAVSTTTVVLAAWVMLVPEPILYNHILVDDAFYYLRIARNIVEGRGPTYDGTTFTNGIQPLWGAWNVLLAWFFRTPSGLLHAGLASSAVTILVGVAALAAFGHRLSWSAWGSLGMLTAFVFPRLDLYMSLMESGLSATLLAGTLAWLAARPVLWSPKWWDVAGFGVLLALLVLVRLDFVFIAAALLAGSVLCRLRVGQPVRMVLLRSGLSAGVFAVLVLPYLVVNQVFFGHIVPVSGRRKHVPIWDVEDPAGLLLTPFSLVGSKLGLPTWLVLSGAGLAIVVVAVGSRRSTWRGHQPDLWSHPVFLSCLAGVLFRAIYLRVFMAPEANRVAWYWVPETVLMAVIFGWAVEWVFRRVSAGMTAPHSARKLVVAAVVVCLLGGTYVVRDNRLLGPPAQSDVYEAAQWANVHAKPGTTCAMYDSGLFAWKTGFDCVALNGLVGDQTLMMDVLKGDYEGIVRRSRPDLLVWWVAVDRLEQSPEGAVLWQGQDLSIDPEGRRLPRRLAVIDSESWSPLVPRAELRTPSPVAEPGQR